MGQMIEIHNAKRAPTATQDGFTCERCGVVGWGEHWHALRDGHGGPIRGYTCGDCRAYTSWGRETAWMAERGYAAFWARRNQVPPPVPCDRILRDEGLEEWSSMFDETR